MSRDLVTPEFNIEVKQQKLFLIKIWDKLTFFTLVNSLDTEKTQQIQNRGSYHSLLAALHHPVYVNCPLLECTLLHGRGMIYL